MQKKFKFTNKIFIVLIFTFLFLCDVEAGSNLKSESSTDKDTHNEKCPISITVQDNLKGNKDMDYSLLDCIYYKTDSNGNYLLDNNGEKIFRTEKYYSQKLSILFQKMPV